MGGNALKDYGVETKRVSTDELYKYFNIIKEYFNDYDIYIADFYRSKPTHGDLDLLIKTSNYKEIRRIVEDEIEHTKIHVNDSVITFDYDNFQIDLICIEPSIWETATVFYTNDPVGNLLGKIAKGGFNLNYGKDGLYGKVYLQNSTPNIYLLKDNHKIFEFLGYDYNIFLKGFDTLVDIFKFISNGKYYDKKLFLPINLDGRDRRRSLKRSSFNLFLEYSYSTESTYIFDDYNTKRVFEWFPDYLVKSKQLLIEDNIRKVNNKKFKDVLTNFKQNKILGDIAGYYRGSKEDFYEFLNDNNIDFINNDFGNFYSRYTELIRMVDKEYGFGKKMGNTIYFHKNYEYDVLPHSFIKNVKRLLPTDFEYTIIKWDKGTENISFIYSEYWDSSNEPIVDDSYRYSNGELKYRKKPNRDQIYHHKWMFVKPSYNGFDYNESKLHSLMWYKKKKYNYRMIGFKDYWDSLNLSESYTDEEMLIANRTSRTSKNTGVVGGNAVVPKFVEMYISDSDLILDYGCGKYPLHAIRLIEKGYNVKKYDFGNNVGDLHDSDALDYKYDLVYASNVLNVQSNTEMLLKTIKEIKSLLKPNGKFIANYPIAPRKNNMTMVELVEILSQDFNVEKLGKNTILMTILDINENNIVYQPGEFVVKDYDIFNNKYINNGYHNIHNNSSSMKYIKPYEKNK